MGERGVLSLSFAIEGVFVIYERNMMASFAIVVNEDRIDTCFVQKRSVQWSL
jgi:hypothetical protein